MSKQGIIRRDNTISFVSSSKLREFEATCWHRGRLSLPSSSAAVNLHNSQIRIAKSRKCIGGRNILPKFGCQIGLLEGVASFKEVEDGNISEEEFLGL
jgi:hypothetical protein